MPLLALAFALAAGSTAGTDVDALQQLWSGIHDTSEQVVVSNDTGMLAKTAMALIDDIKG